MTADGGFAPRGRNPDVLTCIANLSNDEVFTPPEFANRMLDAVAAAWAADHDGADIWADQTVKFLDPFTKSGVFLREITKRLIAGLENDIPNRQERVDHILTQKVFGIGTTQLTSLMARRGGFPLGRVSLPAIFRRRPTARQRGSASPLAACRPHHRGGRAALRLSRECRPSSAPRIPRGRQRTGRHALVGWFRMINQVSGPISSIVFEPWPCLNHQIAMKQIGASVAILSE
jgi:hypothetical protein